MKVFLDNFDIALKEETIKIHSDKSIYHPWLKSFKLLEDNGIYLFNDISNINNADALLAFGKETKLSKKLDINKILLRLEPPCNHPHQWKQSINNIYQKIGSFNSWNIIPANFFYLGYPSTILRTEPIRFSGKYIDFSMICANKHQIVNIDDFASLWRARYDVIRYFELKHKGNFQLYGPNWDYGLRNQSRLHSFAFKLLLKLNISFKLSKTILDNSFGKSFPIKNWRGSCKEKNKIIQQTKFVFCYENFSLDGYTTEKLLDVLNSNAIPIYIGNPMLHNIEKTKKPFLCPYDFDDLDDLIDFCLSMTEQDYFDLQSSMKSNYKKVMFTSEAFALNLSNALSTL